MRENLGWAAAVLVAAMSTSFPRALDAQTFLKRLEERLNGALDERSDPPATRAGRSGGGYLGLTAEDDRESRSIRVVALQPGSPAASAGFRIGDEIITIDGKGVATVDAMAAVLGKRAPGGKVSFGVRRGERVQNFAVTLASRPGTGAAVPQASDGEAELIPHPPGEDRVGIGAKVGRIGDEQRERYGLTVRRGALITGVRRGGAAERAGLREGHVIVGVDGKRVDTPEDLTAKLSGVAAGDTVDVTYYDGPELRRKSLQLTAAEQGTSGNRAEGPEIDPPALADEKPEGRPALRVLERVLDQVARPPGGAPSAGPPAAANADGEALSLRDEVVLLRKQVELLERRLRELEKRLPADLPP